jgi:hypothetical protein
LSIVYGVLILPGLGLAMVSMFAFDAPGSGNSPVTILFALSAAISPLVLIASCVGGLVCSFGEQTQGKLASGRLFGWLPIVNFLLLCLSIFLLKAVCNGSFVCR